MIHAGGLLSALEGSLGGAEDRWYGFQQLKPVHLKKFALYTIAPIFDAGI